MDCSHFKIGKQSLKLGIHDLRVARKVLQHGSVGSLGNPIVMDSSLDLLKNEGKVGVTRRLSLPLP